MSSWNVHHFKNKNYDTPPASPERVGCGDDAAGCRFRWDPLNLGFICRFVSISPVRPKAPAEIKTRRQTLVPRNEGVAASGLPEKQRGNRGRAYVVKVSMGVGEQERQKRLIEVNDQSTAQGKTRDEDTVEKASLRDQKPVAGASNAAAKTQEGVDDVVMLDEREPTSSSSSASETDGREMVDDERQVASGFDAVSKEEGGVIIGNVMMLDEREPSSGSSSASGVDAGEVVEDAAMQENAMARDLRPRCSTPELSPAAARLYSKTRLIPFVKQGITGLARVVVEGAILVLGELVTLCGPVYLTCESNSDASFFRSPPLYPSHIRGLQPLGCYYLQGQSEEDMTAALAVAETMLRISPLRMDNIYICINSGMWRIHLGEETVDGLGREVVLPLVDVDDPFDPLD
ncbi:hypothetical protein FOZ60_012679 [Perkinsus olseni]|uniref:Uncharacterized protein n=2 Tax=Perkinsus olseni TaxID=32597 RepID=A0A7J6PA63_PEROL|nr:hypothetical protein FOZ60_012679 [Perkinsus olseni]